MTKHHLDSRQLSSFKNSLGTLPSQTEPEEFDKRNSGRSWDPGTSARVTLEESHRSIWRFGGGLKSSSAFLLRVDAEPRLKRVRSHLRVQAAHAGRGRESAGMCAYAVRSGAGDFVGVGGVTEARYHWSGNTAIHGHGTASLRQASPADSHLGHLAIYKRSNMLS
jgi:hypothetical protein